MQFTDFLLCLAAFAEVNELPTPTDMTVEVINSGISREDIDLAASFITMYGFVHQVVRADDEQFASFDLADNQRRQAEYIRELLAAA